MVETHLRSQLAKALRSGASNRQKDDGPIRVELMAGEVVQSDGLADARIPNDEYGLRC